MDTLATRFSPVSSNIPAAVQTAAFYATPVSIHATPQNPGIPTRKHSLRLLPSKSSKSLPSAPLSTQSTSLSSPAPKKVLVPIALGTEEMEAVIIIGILRRAGANVIVASVEEKLEVEASGGTKLVADEFISACSEQIFDLVALPGGMPGAARLRDCKILQNITSQHAQNKGLYGAICSAPAVALLPWGLLKRKQTTCHPAFMDKLSSLWSVKANVQVSGELTTSRGPGTSFDFAVSLVQQLLGESVAMEICDSMLLNAMANDSRYEEFNEVLWSLDHPPQVLVPVTNGSEEIEVVTIVDILRRAKANVTVASVEKSLQILTSSGTKIIADKTIRAAAESTYDLIILTGNLSGHERLNKSRILKKLLKEHESAGKFFGAISSSPAVLQEHGLLKDTRATAHPSVISKLNDAVNGTRVVIDGRLITSKGFATATDFSLAIVSKLFGNARARSVAEGLVFDYPR